MAPFEEESMGAPLAGFGGINNSEKCPLSSFRCTEGSSLMYHREQSRGDESTRGWKLIAKSCPTQLPFEKNINTV